jgi:hypothetical protein
VREGKCFQSDAESEEKQTSWKKSRGNEKNLTRFILLIFRFTLSFCAQKLVKVKSILVQLLQ